MESPRAGTRGPQLVSLGCGIAHDLLADAPAPHLRFEAAAKAFNWVRRLIKAVLLT